MNNNKWLTKGFIDEINDRNTLVSEITKLKIEKKAVIMAHYYQSNEVQDIADFIGDSLALAQYGKNTEANIIVIAGVYFMGETAKILSPDKKVLVPDLNAGCSLSDSCQPDEFKKFIDLHPDHKVITYVNTSAEIKALSDVAVTSTNAKAIVDSFPIDTPLIFGPDKNLGNYINSITGRQMVLWDGACHVHEKFSLEKIISLKNENIDAEFIAHPECKTPILVLADHVGSTASLLQYTKTSSAKKFIVATESGILHQMKLLSPEKEFIPAPPNDSTCACNDCEYMKLNTLNKILNCLKYEWPEVIIAEDIRVKALKPLEKMLHLSKSIGL